MAHTTFPDEIVLEPGAVIRAGAAVPPRDAVPAASRPFSAVVLRRFLLGLAWVAAGACLLVGLAAAYTLKRAMKLDIVPGVDVLPDPQIEAAIHAVLALLGFV